MTIAERLSSLGLILPDPPPRGGEYVPAVQVGQLLFVSGHGPYRDGEYIRGKVGADVSLEAARDAARVTMLNVLATVHATLGGLERVERAVKVLGMVNSDPEFEKHSQVIDAGSELLVEVFGDRGRHARSAVGLAALPSGICVEIEVIFAVS
jgi:enamine deaminase RidA (YjgF/YER057c/UK114 family)